MKIWNKLHESENKHIIRTPGIDYEDDLKGEDGVLVPGKDVRIKDGTSFSVNRDLRWSWFVGQDGGRDKVYSG